MVFDGACLPGGNARSCTGQDSDLFFPTLGNLLIVSEDGDAADPDDAEDGIITFDFTTLGDGSVRMESFLLADTDNRRPVITWTVAGGATRSLRLPSTGNNHSRRIDLGFDDVTSFTIDHERRRGHRRPGPGRPHHSSAATSTTTTTTTPPPSHHHQHNDHVPPPRRPPPPTTTTIHHHHDHQTAGDDRARPPARRSTSTVAADGQGADAAPGPCSMPGARPHLVPHGHQRRHRGPLVADRWHHGFGRADCPTRTLRSR